jgi:hypothetical protein
VNKNIILINNMKQVLFQWCCLLYNIRINYIALTKLSAFQRQAQSDCILILKKSFSIDGTDDRLFAEAVLLLSLLFTFRALLYMSKNKMAGYCHLVIHCMTLMFFSWYATGHLKMSVLVLHSSCCQNLPGLCIQFASWATKVCNGFQ